MARILRARTAFAVRGDGRKQTASTRATRGSDSRSKYTRNRALRSRNDLIACVASERMHRSKKNGGPSAGARGPPGVERVIRAAKGAASSGSPSAQARHQAASAHEQRGRAARHSTVGVGGRRSFLPQEHGRSLAAHPLIGGRLGKLSQSSIVGMADLAVLTHAQQSVSALESRVAADFRRIVSHIRSRALTHYSLAQNQESAAPRRSRSACRTMPSRAALLQ